jgi:disulfide bond formation protein DsbB
MKELCKKYAIHFAFLISAFGTAVSLFFSEVWHLPPCDLCWYQRIALYPLVVILFVGLLRSEKHVYQYAYPFAIFGWLIAVYHNLLYYHILPEAAAPCTQVVSCTTEFFLWFRFVTIPFLSLTAFTLILAALFCFQKGQKAEKQIVDRSSKI